MDYFNGEKYIFFNKMKNLKNYLLTERLHLGKNTTLINNDILTIDDIIEIISKIENLNNNEIKDIKNNISKFSNKKIEEIIFIKYYKIQDEKLIKNCVTLAEQMLMMDNIDDSFRKLIYNGYNCKIIYLSGSWKNKKVEVIFIIDFKNDEYDIFFINDINFTDVYL